MSNLSDETKARIAANHAKAMARYKARLAAYANTVALHAKEIQLCKELREIREKETNTNS